MNSPKTFRVVFNWTEEQSGRALILGASYLERIRAAVPFIVYSLQQEENVDFVDLTSSEIHAARLEIHWLWLFSAVSMMLCVVLFLMIRSVFHHLL